MAKGLVERLLQM
jgi:hypothetical protein